ncbi:NHLP bacteriocin system secretion protein [candidate division KSB1 bacterium]|nr:NHLP bacteriocin system secretion protein [candidate division KSB1 bacterium]
MKKQIFRKVSLERLSSPEQLDELMQITTPKGWIALVALSCIVITSLIWGVWGRVPTKVMGRGMLIKPGGVFDVVSLSNGQITDILVKSSELVEKDQVVATIAQPAIEEQIKQAENSLNELKQQHEELVAFGTKDLRLQMEFLAEQRKILLSSIEASTKQLEWSQEKIKVQEELLKQGLITRQTLLTTKQNFYATRSDIENLQNKLKEISVNELTQKNQKQREVLASQLKINEATRALEKLKNELELNSKVVSPYNGRILEVVTNVGEVIRTGEPLFKLDLINREVKDIEAVLYIPPMDGKKVKPGMKVQISPSTVKQEEFGFMIGEVTSVAEFPSTQQGIMRVLKNQQLVGTLSGSGAPFEVYADLIPDDNTESGYKWSSSKGPSTKIHTGTLCSSAIVVREQRPISLVIPKIKEKLGI